MGWPPEWGYLYWFLFHSGTSSYLTFDEIPKDELMHLQEGITNICGLLPCPSCSRHCQENVQQKPPKFTTDPEMVHQYFIRLHNAVNEHQTSKKVLTYEEADNLLEDRLQEQGFSIDTITEAFLPQYWLVLIWMVKSAPSIPKDNFTMTIQKEIRPLLVSQFKNIIYYFPFCRNESTLETLQHFTDGLTDDSFETIMDGCKVISDMYNSVCLEYNQPFMSTEDMQTKWFKEIPQQLPRAEQMRREDHKLMKKLQEELHTLQKRENGEGVVSKEWKDLAVVLMAVMTIIITSISLISLKRYWENRLLQKNTSDNLHSSKVNIPNKV